MFSLVKSLLQINDCDENHKTKVKEILNKDLVFASDAEQYIIAYGESKNVLLVPKFYLKNSVELAHETITNNNLIYEVAIRYFKLKHVNLKTNIIQYMNAKEKHCSWNDYILKDYSANINIPFRIYSKGSYQFSGASSGNILLQCNSSYFPIEQSKYMIEPFFIQSRNYSLNYIKLKETSLPSLFSNPPQNLLFESFMALFGQSNNYNCLYRYDNDNDNDTFYLQELWKKNCIGTKSCLFRLCKGFGHIICSLHIIHFILKQLYFELKWNKTIQKLNETNNSIIVKNKNNKKIHSCFNEALIIVYSQKQKEKWISTLQNHLNVIIKIYNEEDLSLVFEKKNIAIVIVDSIHKIPLPFFIHSLNQWHVPFLFGFTKSDILNPVIKDSFGPILYSFTNENKLWSTLSLQEPTLKRPRDENVNVNVNGSSNYHILSSMFMINKKLVSETTLNEIKEELFMKPKQNDIITLTKGDDHFAFKAYLESEEYLYVPRFYGLSKFPFSLESIGLLKFFNKLDSTHDLETNFKKNYILVNEGSSIDKQYLEPCTIVPRHFQETAVTLLLNRIHNEKYSSGSIIQLACGMGKTNSALLLFHRYGKKTLVLVHTNDLLNQWVDRIHSVLPNIRIGIIQQTVCQVTQDYDIVIGLVQSIASRFDEYYLTYKNDFDSFGLCICDECHRVGNRYFSSAVARIPAKHMIGLTATPERNDGMTTLMHHVLGPIVYARDRDTMNVHIKIIQYLPNIQVRKIYTKKKAGPQKQLYNRSRMISDLCEEPKRIELIYNIILYTIAQKRNIMFLSERTDLLFILEKMLKLRFSNNEVIIGVSMAKTKKEARQYAYENAQVLLTTYQMSSEGLDVVRLDTLILGSPKSNIIQALGRILRESPDKQTPTVYDIYDVMDAFQGSFWSRNRLYQKESYDIEYVDQSLFLSDNMETTAETKESEK